MYFCFYRLSSGTELSTGLYALMIMKDVCGEINVYGMVPEDYCRYVCPNIHVVFCTNYHCIKPGR